MPARTDNALLFRTTAIWAAAVMTLSLVTARVTTAQDKSVRPGINDSFQNPDVGQFKGRFEVESREVFAKRVEIVAASGVTEGKTVADIGAGTGLFTRLFAEK